MIRAVIFDLDNTLHNARPHIFPHINRAMTEYLQSQLGLSEDGAGELRRHYWKRYGATLLGLMRLHETDPRHFLWHTHQLPDLERMLVQEPLLRATLRRLPGRKFVFSNAPVHYARAVLKALAIADLFDGVFQTGRWPIGIYPGWLRYSVTFLVPVAFAVTVPAQAVTSRLQWQTLALAVVFAVAVPLGVFKIVMQFRGATAQPKRDLEPWERAMLDAERQRLK